MVYRQFTNAEFTKQVERTADMEHLGIMGIASKLKQLGCLDPTFISHSALFSALVMIRFTFD